MRDENTAKGTMEPKYGIAIMQVSIKCKDNCRPEKKGEGTIETFKHWNILISIYASYAVEPGNAGYKVMAISDAKIRFDLLENKVLKTLEI